MGDLTKEEIEKLYYLCSLFNERSKQDGIHLRVIETKGTYYFYPEFEAKD